MPHYSHSRIHSSSGFRTRSCYRRVFLHTAGALMAHRRDNSCCSWAPSQQSYSLSIHLYEHAGELGLWRKHVYSKSQAKRVLAEQYHYTRTSHQLCSTHIGGDWQPTWWLRHEYEGYHRSPDTDFVCPRQDDRFQRKRCPHMCSEQPLGPTLVRWEFHRSSCRASFLWWPTIIQMNSILAAFGLAARKFTK